MKKLIISVLLAVLSIQGATGQGHDALYEGFVQPGKECYPRVWWHWMNGNISKEGIRKDMEWMDRVGIAGVHQFNARLKPEVVVVPRRLPVFSDEWAEMFRYALDVSDSLGLEYTIASSPGWSITGGPWVKVEDAQKKLTWRTMSIIGGSQVNADLPEPIRYSGWFQEEMMFPNQRDKYLFYKDIAVLAIRTEAIAEADTVSEWIKRSGFTTDLAVNSSIPELKISRAIQHKDIIDISKYCKDGKISWKAPQGEWTIYRFGYNLIGKHNGPCEEEGIGLEADKLSARAMDNYYRDYLNIMNKASGGRLGTSVKYMLIDSYEAGKQTWTDLMEQEFRKRRGYSVIPWLPVLTGLAVESKEATEGFLFDWRLTLGEMISDYHYGVARKVTKEFGMGLYGETQEWKTAYVGDGLDPRKYYDIPMGAMWVRYGEGLYGEDLMSKADISEAASAAHIYGQNICGAESFTVDSGFKFWGRYPAYQCYPGMLKRLADSAISMGLNRFLLHCGPHQPVDSLAPGLGLGYYGNWFNRQDTWAEESRPWYDYLARNCYLMQQGRYSADVLIYYGEDRNSTGTFSTREIPTPKGYGSDLVNIDILRNWMKVKNGKLCTESGMQYSAICIDTAITRMSLEALKVLYGIARKGVLIYGSIPAAKAQLKDSDRQFNRLRSKFMSLPNVCSEGTAEDFLAANGIQPDWILPETQGKEVLCIHRVIDGGHIYRISNISPEAYKACVSLRTDGLRPEIWNAETCEKEEVSYCFRNGRTEVCLDMGADDCKIIVLREPTDVSEYNKKELEAIACAKVEGPWKVDFQPDRGAPASAVFNTLTSYTERPEKGIRDFSGTASYKTVFKYDGKGGYSMVLDLGKVAVMAHVYLNGKDLGTLWHAPYKVDVTTYLNRGFNELRIDIVNLWANRLIADSALPQDKRISYTAFKFYSPGDPQVESGLLGPVTITEYK